MHGPVLTTERLRIEPFAAAHVTTRYVGWLNDPQVVQFSEQRHRRHTPESAAAYLSSFAGTPHYFWAIISLDPALGHVGNMTAHVDTPNSVADVGILIGERTTWGRGYGFEAWNAVCRFLLDEAGIRKVTGGAMSNNTRMLSIMRRAGMREDGRRYRHMVVDGAEVDLIHMAVFRNVPGPTAPA
jgi:RimJ/RimL family protein N-acetyltransferase